jgi:uncharacterized protein
MPADDIAITNNSEASRFETEVDSHLAVIEYERAASRITFTHTRVPVAIEGRGVGTALVRAALAYAREARLEVVPQCPFVRAYIKRHPEYRSLVWAGWIFD